MSSNAITLLDQAVPAAARRIAERLADAGFRAWVVGGCVRDVLMGRPSDDWDLCSDARPEDVQKLFRRVLPTGVQHGTVTVMDGKIGYEITTLRGESGYSDGRRPDKIEFISDIDGDLARRDFTVNAIAFDPLQRMLEDPFSGLKDLENKTLRAVRDPYERFAEDGLRALRAARFVSSLEFNLDPNTEAAIAATLPTLAKVSRERVYREWVKALKSREPSRAFLVMLRTKMLPVLTPLLAEYFREIDAHNLDRTPRVDARLALLFAPLFLQNPRAVEDEMRQLRCSQQELDTTRRTLGNYLAFLKAESDADIRRATASAGRELYALCIEVGAVLGNLSDSEKQALLTRTQAQLMHPLTLGELAIRGDDLMRIGLTGKAIGNTLHSLLSEVISNPEKNERDTLLNVANAIADQSRK